MKLEYIYKTEPYNHQKEFISNHWNTPSYGIFWEQGCGKAKPVIDNTAILFDKNLVNGLLIIAPNGVQLNWVTDELPAHMPDIIWGNTLCCIWRSSKAKTKKQQISVKELLGHDGLSVLSMSYGAIMTDGGRRAAWAFLKNRKCLYCLDEAHYIKNPNAKTTTRVIASGNHAPYKRLLTGTPVAERPFDLYSQIKWIENNFWDNKGMRSYHHFKSRYGNWVTRQRHGSNKSYRQLVSLRNINDLEKCLRSVGTRLTKDQVLDLPPKIYTKRYVELTSQQKKLYTKLSDELKASAYEREVMNTPLAITGLLRLQQIICGYMPSIENDDELELIEGRNPRLEVLKDIVDNLGHKVVIWARFRKDIDLIMKLLGNSAVRYDGSVGDEYRAKAKYDFQNSEVKAFVSNPSAGGTGITLNQAKTVIYYSNSFSMVHRKQSEDRTHRIGQDKSVNYIDIIAPGTIDSNIVSALLSKNEIAVKITGDKIKEWL